MTFVILWQSILSERKLKTVKYYPPKFNESNFHCPFCYVYASQHWQELTYQVSYSQYHKVASASQCSHCANIAVWVNEKLLYPDQTGVEPAHPEMPDDIKTDYDEASSIVNRSPRGAAALLRLAIQKLCVELGEKGKKIDDDIKELVKKGLPVEIQQALDIVRVIGNESVHPGEMNLKDDVETATRLFSLINFIVDNRISQPKKLAALYSSLPESKRKGIENRDKTTS